MTAPTPRQVLYALVAGGFVLSTALLVIAGAVTGIAPHWWSITLGAFTVASAILIAFRWRSTGMVLMIAIGLFLLWMVGTLAIL